ncbi:MAG: S41 family peptidase [Candidatus Limnocylindria bacterium]
MRRMILGLAAAAFLVAACTGGTAASPSPTRTPDIRRAKLDIAYTAFVTQDVHHATSKKALEAALEAVKQEIVTAGGKADVRTPEFTDIEETSLEDFKKFADVVSQLAAQNPNVSANRIADAAITGMIRVSPDCHTQYITGGRVINSSTRALSGGNAVVPAGGTSLGGPDEAGLTGKILPSGIAYITWREFVVNGTYKGNDALKAILERALAQGARAWIFDLRGNLGGSAVDMTSFFLDGEPRYRIELKNGFAGTSTAIKALRLPPEYQLPIVVIVNGRSASASEVFALSLQENNRATIVGQRTRGCLGGFFPNGLVEGSDLHVAAEEFVGAVTGAKYNNVGMPPDVPADDATAVDKAIEILKAKIGQ